MAHPAINWEFNGLTQYPNSIYISVSVFAHNHYICGYYERLFDIMRSANRTEASEFWLCILSVSIFFVCLSTNENDYRIFVMFLFFFNFYSVLENRSKYLFSVWLFLRLFGRRFMFDHYNCWLFSISNLCNFSIRCLFRRLNLLDE